MPSPTNAQRWLDNLQALDLALAANKRMTIEVWFVYGNPDARKRLASFLFSDGQVRATYDDPSYGDEIASDGIYLREAGGPVYPSDGALFIKAVVRRHVRSSAVIVTVRVD